MCCIAMNWESAAWEEEEEEEEEIRTYFLFSFHWQDKIGFLIILKPL